MARERKARATSLSPQDFTLLELWGRNLRDAFEEMPYLVGSAGEGGAYRDVDVRMLCDRLWVMQDDYRLRMLNLSITLWGRQVTGLPIDFQFQGPVEFHKYDGEKRNALGVRDFSASIAPPAREEAPTP